MSYRATFATLAPPVIDSTGSAILMDQAAIRNKRAFVNDPPINWTDDAHKRALISGLLNVAGEKLLFNSQGAIDIKLPDPAAISSGISLDVNSGLTDFMVQTLISFYGDSLVTNAKSVMTDSMKDDPNLNKVLKPVLVGLAYGLFCEYLLKQKGSLGRKFAISAGSDVIAGYGLEYWNNWGKKDEPKKTY